MTRFVVAVAVACLGGISAWSDGSPYQDVLAASKAFDTEAFASAHERVVALAGAHANDFETQQAAAESFLLWATRIRNERHTRPMDGKTDEQLQRDEAELAAAGLVYAERAVECAKTDSEISRAHRAMGELYSHQITGMVSGMRNGPKAKLHIEKALDLAPDDPECMRAIALMYLHNPPISGGDVPRAIETFSACAELAPDSDIYPVLLAMAYQKAHEPAEAREAASHALELNPKNRDAQAILDALEAESK